MEEYKKNLLKKGIITLSKRTIKELDGIDTLLLNEAGINGKGSQEYINARNSIENYKTYLLGRIENDNL